jgi:hypothetical protein
MIAGSAALCSKGHHPPPPQITMYCIEDSENTLKQLEGDFYGSYMFQLYTLHNIYLFIYLFISQFRC